MRVWVDLHIHSCLSPCADEDMTPNNIVNMANLKGLDIIAITDHNSARNCRAVVEAGISTGITVIPGMELCTSEEIHLILLFPGLKEVHAFEKLVYENLTHLKNREDIFGTQIIMDSEDNEIDREERLLSGACNIDAETAVKRVRGLGGIAIPAHINRQSFSMLNTLGAIPEEYGFKLLECSKSCYLKEFINDHPELVGYRFIRSSDAHFLTDILEQEVCLEVEEKSIAGLINALVQHSANSLHIF